MAKKLGRIVLFGLVAGAAAAGVYHYLQNKEAKNEELDDYDDLDNFEDAPAKESTPKNRNYVSLDSCKEFVADTLDKAKDAITKVSKKLQESMDSEQPEDDSFEILEDGEIKEMPAEDSTEVEKETAKTSKKASKAKEEEEPIVNGSTEEFFDDDEQ
ncbi:MAG TPA: hypothetical protein PLZ77_10965 [Lachnospiraceae bacterium]|nr:hypothetical protein [Lachnospiraceae bacterium]HPF30605.1 hypothetical protein [Lachnospiraceae bacterium]